MIHGWVYVNVGIDEYDYDGACLDEMWVRCCNCIGGATSVHCNTMMQWHVMW